MDKNEAEREQTCLFVLIEITFRSPFEVRAQDSNVLIAMDRSREHTTEGIETAFLRSGNHLGNEEHERTTRITSTNRIRDTIIERTIVQVLNTEKRSREQRRKQPHKRKKDVRKIHKQKLT